MIDATYILKRKKEVETYLGLNLSEIPSAVIDQLNDFHAELVSLIFALDKEKNAMREEIEYLTKSRKRITEMFIEENTENAERNIKQVKWYVNNR